MLLLLIYLFLALFVSFLCSVMEAVLLSTTIPFLKVKEKEGFGSARKIMKLKRFINKPLSAILSLNTIAHTVGAAGVGAQATLVFGKAYFGVVSAVLTFLILVISEIIPKTIGARYWKKLTIPAGNIIRFTIFITYPLVIISALVTKLVSSKKSGKTTSREEISALADIGAEEGIVGATENKIIQNLIRLKNIKVHEIMTPRTVVSAANEEMDLPDFQKDKKFLYFSRIPVYAEEQDRITGYVLRQTVLEELTEGRTSLKLKDIKREIAVVPDITPTFNAFETLIDKKDHIAMVVDEYGGMSGIVTMEDIIETLIGFEIIDERDAIKDMQRYARERWKKRQAKYNLLQKFRNEEK